MVRQHPFARAQRAASLPRNAAIAIAIAVPCLTVLPSPASAAPAFTAFESGQVRPLALSPDKKHLFAVNTPDNRLEIFRIHNNTLTRKGSVPVGLEPVAVAARTNDEVWVVNHLSDSISVVKLTGANGGFVQRTLLVGDEPRDIVFAGPERSRAFITAAHRGQNRPGDPQLTTPSVGRADVWVFDSEATGASLGGTPLTILSLFSDTPRALAVTPDGSKVYAAAFHSGNRTTTAFFPAVVPPPTANFEGIPQDPVSVIVRHDGVSWVDENGNSYDDQVNLWLPDKDVFVIDAMTNPPAPVPGPPGYFTGVGTVLFNMAVNPVSGKVYVSNTEAFNEVRFEGEGTLAGSSLRGHLHESRITVLDGAQVLPRHLNKHIDYSTCCDPVPNAESVKSLAFPQEMAISANGAVLYVAALGSSKIGIYDTAALEMDAFVPDTAYQIPVSGGGPTGLVLDDARNRLYVLTRFDNAVSVIDTQTHAEVAHVPMHNPEPPSIVQGRRFLYDASLSSSHGDSACASCHVFGDFDSLAWDLGNPDGTVLTNPGPFVVPPELDPDFHPMKGPMTTQSLRGMANHGPMHWRGDRTGGNDAPSAQPDSGVFDEGAAFMKFLPAFVDLLGSDQPIATADMEAFRDFALQVVYPPNPIRALDNSLNASEQAGRDAFFNPDILFRGESCDGCHTLDPGANPGVDRPGFFGGDGRSSLNGGGAMLKTPHLRNMYQKVGMFGLSPAAEFAFPGTDFSFMGDQVRGYGYFHDGSVDTLFRFISVVGFTFPPSATDPDHVQLRKDIESYMLAFDSNLAPIVGQQITLTAVNGTVTDPRIDLLVARADAGECELLAKSHALGVERGFFYLGGGLFQPDLTLLPPVSDTTLRLLPSINGRPITYTCAPPGSGRRIGIDRDGDSHLDGDERAAGSDPGDPASTP